MADNKKIIQEHEKIQKLIEKRIQLEGEFGNLADKRAERANQIKKELIAAEKELLAWEEKATAKKAENVSLDKKLLKDGKSLNNLKRKQAARHTAMKQTLDDQLDGGEISKSQYQDQLDIVEAIANKNVDIEGLLEAQSDLGGNVSDEMKKYLGEQRGVMGAQEKSKALMGAADDLTGGMAGNAMDAFKTFKNLGPAAGAMTVGIGAAVALLVSFSGKIDAIGGQFGVVATQSREIRGQLFGAEQEAVKLGKGIEEVFEAISSLTDEFGVGFKEARGMAASIVDTSVAMGLSVSEAGSLVGVFSTITGLSNEGATALSKQVYLLANASDVAPQAVLKDIAGSTVVIAKFTDKSGKNIARGAIQARKLGTNLETSAAAAESMLDYETAVGDALTASILTNKEINISKLQRLSLEGDLEGVAKEQRRILGDQTDFLAMNVIQREALAKAVGLEVDQAAKMLDKQKEAITLAGELAGQPGFDEVVGEGGISTLTKMMGLFKSTGALLTNTLGPILNVVLIAVNALLGLWNFVQEAAGINTLLRFLGGQGFSYDPIGAGKQGLQGIGMSIKSDIPSANTGAITTEDGLMNVHSNEAIIPIEKLSVMLSEAMTPIVTAINTLNEKFEKEYVPALAQSNIDGAKRSGREMSRQFNI